MKSMTSTIVGFQSNYQPQLALAGSGIDPVPGPLLKLCPDTVYMPTCPSLAFELMLGRKIYSSLAASKADRME